ncbi:carboxymuconolactone decarboxylase family protein [[Clostridium] innocuum]|nr:carboxymuconolactone decarboxylase family protein [[Clostridium] innocuum]MCR0578854.1 carboxymuconolactone decarboxylase family protein [[Clostridium] innocuum]
MNKTEEMKCSYLPQDAQMRRIMQYHIEQEVYAHGTLSFEMREFITLAVLAANHGGRLIQEHVAALLRQNIKPCIIKEVVYQAIPYAGLLSVNDALLYVNEVLPEAEGESEMVNMQTVDEETRFDSGLRAQCSVFAKEVILNNHKQAPKDLKHMQDFLSAHCFGDFYTRKGLDMKQRELLTFCVIASLGGCENQLRAHIQANLTAGNTRDDLLEAITQIQPYIGFPRTLNAISIVNEVIPYEES